MNSINIFKKYTMSKKNIKFNKSKNTKSKNIKRKNTKRKNTKSKNTNSKNSNCKIVVKIVLKMMVKTNI